MKSKMTNLIKSLGLPVGRPRRQASGSGAHVYIIDGDTLYINDEKIRIHGIDTPEIKDAQCIAERMLGQKAKEFLVRLVPPGADIEIERLGRDQYDRTLARLYVNGRNIGEALIEEGLARRYDGRKRGWCD